jgi:glycosyltransferase involved in cell wall biosynthesis
MTNVTIVSAFRNGGLAHVDRYMDRINSLNLPPQWVRVITVEGDSTDDTYDRLQTVAKYDKRVTVVKCDLGKPHYGSIVHPERFEILATVFNAGLNAIDVAWSDYVLFLPSDIEYEPKMVFDLICKGKDIVAPFMWMNGRFYDIWGFVEPNGRNFEPFTPEDAQAFGKRPIRMACVGGVVLMSADVVRAGCRYSTVDVDHGLCRDAIAHGFGVWADPSTNVYHPSR